MSERILITDGSLIHSGRHLDEFTNGDIGVKGKQGYRYGW
jgi:hypothetical protein